LDLNKLIASVPPDIYESLKKAVEIGKWDNGAKLTSEQTENALQIIIAYDELHKAEDERVGYVAPKPDGCETDLSLDDLNANKDWQPLDIKHPDINE